MQVILVLETRSSAKTDFMYIKAAFDHFYGTRVAQLSKIFAKNKSELIKQDKKILEKTNRYNGSSIVVVVADFDRGNDVLNSQIIQYCNNKGYRLVWMNLDVEEVFLGVQIPDKLKTKTATDFQKKKNVNISANVNLNVVNPLKRHPASNFLNIFDKYFKRIT